MLTWFEDASKWSVESAAWLDAVVVTDISVAWGDDTRSCSFSFKFAGMAVVVGTGNVVKSRLTGFNLDDPFLYKTARGRLIRCHQSPRNTAT